MIRNVADTHALSARWLISEAFSELLAVQPFEKLTVHAIVRRAGISRSTFYLHYRDKYDLLHQMTERITGELIDLYGTNDSDESLRLMLQEYGEDRPLPGSVAICEHVRAYQSFYRNRFQDPAFAAMLSERLLAKLRLIYQDDTHAAFAAYGTVGFMSRWLSEGLPGSSVQVALRLSSVAMLSLPQVRTRARRE